MVLFNGNNGTFAPKYACNIFTQVRNATKRAAGSRTSMKDSAGRRLGPKKYEGQVVKVGEIIMRQRGTKLYPGENTGIGKDHTIYAKEPGVVRYYLDPFHPKRKFVGVSLNRDVRLPLPHFEPRVRRFGHQVLTHPRIKKEEEDFLPRKQLEAKESILHALEKREQARSQLAMEYRAFLQDELKLQLSDIDMATSYLIRLRSCLKNGFLLTDAQYNARHYLELEYKLQAQRENTEDKLSEKLKLLHDTTNKLDETTSFDNKLHLIKHVSDKQKKELKEQLLKALHEKGDDIETKQQREEVKAMFSKASEFLTFSEEVHLRRVFLKPVKSENEATIATSPGKKTINIKRFNDERRKLEIVLRKKSAFLSKL
ncbi:MRP7 (YNL005C) [Zygosaccharomyces parabailii]|uniref:Large ribosomal subunit protein bL27m n=1 Tax=Zygosaccharomyces bailii (strain CLIB 213 / ATCC 58445 / CBS 680 / BCRC 21525 / NBRC 1098 / NCYC 1416 / NRRL Y-2227) TaxID=1333698 RepID=A0A8J2X962_ZYGB2|nr:MRP7 (YNL005C) [Zygosaccharomyces parabailii]CDF90128.1 ZYBA0S06-01222g1_1 [Zygosaccharomyces bailii CLIB 213]CDH16651.1 related to 54S ribosomal protein L2,mitochondrial [Zygosaccharomyces bailii ISA1307]